MVQIVTDLIADEEDRRTELYWKEHADERQALLEAKAKDQEEIRKIEREACAVNADAEIKPIKDEIKALEKTRDSVGAEEMAQLQKELEKVRAEYNQIGFFKFKERKAAQEKVTEAERLLNAKKGEVGKEKLRLQNKIDAKKSQIEKIEKRVENERATIRKRKEPYNEHMSYIDRKLNRKY